MILAAHCIYALKSLQNQTLIAIKAPHGSSLEVPDPDEVWSLHKWLAEEIRFVLVPDPLFT